jgi:hypothetical protein
VRVEVDMPLISVVEVATRDRKPVQPWVVCKVTAALPRFKNGEPHVVTLPHPDPLPFRPKEVWVPFSGIHREGLTRPGGVPSGMRPKPGALMSVWLGYDGHYYTGIMATPPQYEKISQPMIELIDFTKEEEAKMLNPPPPKKKDDGKPKGKRPRTDRQGAQPSASA